MIYCELINFQMDLPKFDEVIDNLYMPSQWGINLQGDSRIER